MNHNKRKKLGILNRNVFAISVNFGNLKEAIEIKCTQIYSNLKG